MQNAKRPADALREIGAPRELVEWVRKMPPEEAVRRAWIDVTRPDWLPYLAVLRGLSHDAIVRATCACVLAAMGQAAGEAGDRIAAVLNAGIERGPTAIASAEDELDDLRRVMLAHGERPGAPAWMQWCRIVLELARAARRGNPLIGVALALRMLVTSGTGGRRASTDLIARFRDRLVLG